MTFAFCFFTFLYVYCDILNFITELPNNMINYIVQHVLPEFKIKLKAKNGYFKIGNGKNMKTNDIII